MGGKERQRVDIGGIDWRPHILRLLPGRVARFACGKPEVVSSQASGTIRREIHRQFVPGKNSIVVVVNRVDWWPDIDRCRPVAECLWRRWRTMSSRRIASQRTEDGQKSPHDPPLADISDLTTVDRS